jgi:hypothetical protein
MVPPGISINVPRLVQAGSGAILSTIRSLMDTGRKRASKFPKYFGLAFVIALAVQAIFTWAFTLPETRLAPSPRLILGLVSVPFSAFCGTLFVRSRHRDRTRMQLTLVFFGLGVIVILAGFLFSAMTGNYDLP